MFEGKEGLTDAMYDSHIEGVIESGVMFEEKEKINDDNWNEAEEKGIARINESTCRCHSHQTNDGTDTRSRDRHLTTNAIEQCPRDQTCSSSSVGVDQSKRS